LLSGAYQTVLEGLPVVKSFYRYKGFQSKQPAPEYRAQLIEFLRTHNVGAIIVENSAMPGFRHLPSVLGIEPINVGGVWIYQIPAISRQRAR
jgi:hypothetical protein